MEMTGMKRIVLTFALVAVAAISAACSTAAAKPAPSGPVADGPTVVAKDLKFAPANVEVKAGANFTLHFDNQRFLSGELRSVWGSAGSGVLGFRGSIGLGRAGQLRQLVSAGERDYRRIRRFL